MIFDKVKMQFCGARRDFSMNDAGITGNPYAKKKKDFNPYLALYMKISKKYIIVLNVKV